MGAEIVGNDGDIVIGTERTEKDIRGVLHVANEVIAVGSELKQHYSGNGRLGGADTGDCLWNAVFKNEEIWGFQARDELVGLIEDDVDVEVNDWDVDAE